VAKQRNKFKNKFKKNITGEHGGLIIWKVAWSLYNRRAFVAEEIGLIILSPWRLVSFGTYWK